MSILYIVATPIGNLEDITYRAVKVLSGADIIACEDTRHTQILLSKYEITGKRCIACHARNEATSAPGIIKLLEQGLSVAYVSDAGTPGISDPGSRLVRAVREAGFTVVPIPGASAVSTLVSASGMYGKTFTFEGFLSQKAGKKKTRLTELLKRGEPFVIYESPYRIDKTLTLLSQLEPDRLVTAGRELTKQFEEIRTAKASELLCSLNSLKGEFALLIHGRSTEDAEEENADD